MLKMYLFVFIFTFKLYIRFYYFQYYKYTYINNKILKLILYYTEHLSNIYSYIYDG